MKDIIVTDKAVMPIGPYSQAVRADGFLFTAQIALDPNTNTLLEGDVVQQNGTRAGKLEGDSHAPLD